MLEVLLGLLAKEKPAVSAVIDCRQVKHRDLSIIEVRYVRDGQYYAAKSYATSSWVARTPMGPVLNLDGTIKIDTIEDVAEVDTYSTAADLRRRPWPCEDSLVRLQEQLDRASLELIKKHYPMLQDVLYIATFSYTPFPTVQVCFARGDSCKQFIGTAALDMMGNTQVLSKASDEMDDIYDVLRCVCLPAFQEEMCYA